MYLFLLNANPEAVPGATSSSMGVCASVVLFYGRLCLRRPLSWGFVLRPLEAGFCVKPSSLDAVVI